MSILSYLYCKCVVTILRVLIRFASRVSANPDEVRHIPSRDAGRSIQAHVYHTSSPASGPSPVLLNWHGSGFVFPRHGSDEEFCKRVCRETRFTVFDLPYRLAPENPFPAALNDVEDAIRYILERPDEFDLSRISLSGFSAGGNLAIAAASNFFPSDTFRSLVAFYPPIDLNTDAACKFAPEMNSRSMPVAAARFFNRSYLPSGVDKRDPRISPRFAPLERFPRRFLMITAGGDSLAPEAEELADRLRTQQGWHVVCQRMAGCKHGWDKRTQEGTWQRAARDRAYQLVIEELNK